MGYSVVFGGRFFGGDLGVLVLFLVSSGRFLVRFILDSSRDIGRYF